MSHITERQQEVMDAVRRLIAEQGHSPTINEVAREIGVTDNAAYDHLKALRRAGLVNWELYKPRTLKVL